MNPLIFIKELFSQLFEQIPIINEQNQIIGKTSRLSSFILRKPIRAVNIFIFKDSSFNELLIQKRRWWMRFPNKLADCAGAVPCNLSYEETAYKELQEELFHNTPLPNIKLKKIAEFKDTSINPFTYNQLFMGIHPGPFSPSPFEVKVLSFIAVENIKDDLKNPKTSKQYAPPFKEAFKHFEEWNKSQNLAQVSALS